MSYKGTAGQVLMQSTARRLVRIDMQINTFAADGAAVPAQHSGNLADGLLGLQDAVNLVSFFSIEVFVYLATWTWRFKWP